MNAALWHVGDAEYFADKAWLSNSMLKDFTKSPSIYHGRYVAGTLPKETSTAAMDFGTAVHALLLHPKTWRDHLAVRKESNGRTNEGKAYRAAFAAEHAGKVVLDDDDFARAQNVAAAVLANEQAAVLLDAPEFCEVPIRWHDAATGIGCKCKPDVVCSTELNDGRRCVLDLKVVDDPYSSGFERAIFQRGYHRQAAWYEPAVRSALGESERRHWVLCAAGSEPPHDIRLYVLAEESVDLGAAINRAALKRLKDCIERDSWHDDAGQMKLVFPPRWAALQHTEGEW